MLKRKQSQIHIEMIMSFVLFVGFITAILLFINPVKEQKISLLSLNLVQEKIMSNVSISYGYIPLIIKSGVTIKKSCFFIENPLATATNVFVQNDNAVLDSRISGGKIYIQTIENSRFYKLYFSSVFVSHSLEDFSNCRELSSSSGEYSLGALSIASAVLYENLVRLNELYNLDYASLKSNLKIQNNFDFMIYNFSRAPIFERTSERNFGSSNILAREIVLNMVNSSNNKIDGIMNLRVV